MEDIAEYCDIFYIGGTKVGAFCGEAVVFTKENAPRHFVTLIKQHGALLAKGWFLGVQFDTLFTDDLYMKISKNAIETAARTEGNPERKRICHRPAYGFRFIFRHLHVLSIIFLTSRVEISSPVSVCIDSEKKYFNG